MSNQQNLLQTLPPEARDEAEQLLQSGNAAPDMRSFVGELHRRGVLDSGQLRSTVLALEASRRIDSVETKVPDGPQAHEILGPLGEGAMGEVLLAKDELGRVVAVKRLLPHMSKHKGLTRRFFKEAQITAQLDHPSIVPVYGLVDAGGRSLAYAMKLVRGRTLEDFIEEAAALWERGSIDEDHALPTRLDRFLHVCDAIAYAHDKGVVHRDLKPENIMVGAFGQVIVMDWGIAKLVGGAAETFTTGELKLPGTKAHQTRIGMVMGTPRYMSPEQAKGANDVLDGRSDQYALGLILMELITLRPAVKGDLELEECLEWARTAKRVPAAVLHRKQPMPKQLLAVVDKACRLNADERYPNVQAMAEDVRRFLRDEPVTAYRDGIMDRVGRWIGRNRGKVMALTLLGALLGVTAVGATGVVGITALWGSQYRAEQAEHRLQTLIEETNVRAMELDAAFRDWNGQLNALSYAAEKAMSGNISRVKISWDKNAAPPDLKPSNRYNRAVDLNWPDLAAAGKQNRDEMKDLIALGPSFRATLSDSGGLLSSGRPGAQRNAIEAGVPLVWAKIYTADGFVASYPGLSPFKANRADFRNEAWFLERKHNRSVAWRTPHIDRRGMGLVARASRTLTDQDGNFLGVAVVDMALQALADRHLKGPEWVERSVLLDGEGNTVLSSDDKPATMTGFSLVPAPHPDLTAAAVSHSSGSKSITLDGVGYQATWAPLRATGWTFVTLVPDAADIEH